MWSQGFLALTGIRKYGSFQKMRAPLSITDVVFAGALNFWTLSSIQLTYNSPWGVAKSFVKPKLESMARRRSPRFFPSW